MSKRTARIEVFRVGTFTPMQGTAITYTPADLLAAADAYDFTTAPAPAVIGHPTTDAPAYGWAKSFEFDASTGKLYATLDEIQPAFAEAVKQGSYKKVSMQFFRPDAPSNPAPGTWYPKHIGFLGGAAPAVPGLANVEFSGSPDETVSVTAEFGEPGFEHTASMFRALRDFLIGQFGQDAADKAIPSYAIEWLGETEIDKPGGRLSFAAPTPAPTKESDLTKTDPAFAAREADLTQREAALKAREREIASAANVSFAESLVTEGKLLPASKDQLVAILNALPADTAVSFAAGQPGIAADKALRDLLAAQPKVVSFGREEIPGEGVAAAVSFASDGKEVDRDQLELHAKATDYQRKHPGTLYLDAVRAVS
ncbi:MULTISPECIES: hypothetical protein [unclassified Ensifer]|uniref:hypothetical protein n=1 Tax=unclassified Ensifer TaxID=2633371 RepID=UPI00081321D1|nr:MULTISPECIES: hypothetical protein [unclassified Ensifer]OCP17381.1 hypothetical protein BC361_07935 [Ensifer sp. LC54]OCP28714.1 hypothetical protein BC363_02425 [Ensifer sp. LC384]